MVRSFLQFVGSASAVVWATLLLGSLFSASVVADPSSDPSIAVPLETCQDCFQCNAKKDGCDYYGGRGCNSKSSCKCSSNGGNAVCTSTATP